MPDADLDELPADHVVLQITACEHSTHVLAPDHNLAQQHGSRIARVLRNYADHLDRQTWKAGQRT